MFEINKDIMDSNEQEKFTRTCNFLEAKKYSREVMTVGNTSRGGISSVNKTPR